MPTTITLPSKFTQDENGNKFAPITTPNAVRFPDGTNLNDHLGEGSVIPIVLLSEPSTPEMGMVKFDVGNTNKFYQYAYRFNQSGGAWAEISTPHKAVGLSTTSQQENYYGIVDGVVSQEDYDDWVGWYINYTGAHDDIGQMMYFDDLTSVYLPSRQQMHEWSLKYTMPSNGIPSTDMTSAVQTSLGKANTAYQKPSAGIPASDLASGVVGLPVSAGTVTTLANIPTTNRLVVATLSANQSTVSVLNGVTALTAGCELHVIVKATAAVTITLPTSSPYINYYTDSTLSIVSGGHAELNFMSDGTNIYVRAII